VSAAPEPAIVKRLRARQAEHQRRGLLYRAAFVVAGLVVLAAGIAMLALPGPAFVVIPVGLAILSLEFEWAERLLESALVKADRARRSAREASPAQRLAIVVLIALLAAAVVGAAIAWDIPYVPV
jgi:uncharacterized protein (TIGR02611 family)